MSGTDKRALVPRLRFPEFREAHRWDTPKLEQISVPIDERVGEQQLTPVSISAGVGFVNQADKFGRDISGNQYRLYTVVRDGDFVYNKGNSLKFPQGCVYDLKGWGKVAAPNVFICFRLKSGYENAFFRYIFEQNIHGLQLKKHITSGARSNGLLNIGKDAFFGIKIPTPKREEQQKIADCLSSLDDFITAETRKLDTLKTHKNGLMEQLFPREGEAVPRLRFPEFEDAKEWEPTTIGEIADFQSGGTPSKENPAFWDGSIPWASAKDMKHLFLNDTEDHITPAAVKRGAKQVPAGTVLILTRGMTLLKDVPISVATRHMSFNQDVKALQAKTNLDSRFLAYLLLSCKQRLLSLVDIAGHGTGRLDTDELKALDVALPRPAEQRRIAECLFSFEELITVQARKIEALRMHKKAMLQLLFPAVDEMPA